MNLAESVRPGILRLWLMALSALAFGGHPP